MEAVNYTGFYSLNNCVVYVEGGTIPSDWDSSWYSGIAQYRLNSQGGFSADGNYYYEVIDGKLYLVRYLNTVAPKAPIIIPKKIDGKMVYGIRSYCFEGKQSNSSSNRYIFVVPDTITVMESYAIYLYNYGYSYFYLEFASASDIPSTWSSGWAYGSYGYTSRSYLTRYYVDSWELIDNVPTVKS